MLAGVRTPDGKTVTFGYDALGRRVSKTVGTTIHRFGWDGNTVLHEWDIEESDRPKLATDETGREEYDGTEKHGNLVTWVYDGTSFTPVAKVAGGERYTIVHDYLGTPTQAYDSCGRLVWEMLLDVYGVVMESRGDRSLVPFRYQGQYEDTETGLYYNRFRYYSPRMGMYISSDPIGLAGNNPTLYGYVSDVNIRIDTWGLTGIIYLRTDPYTNKKYVGKSKSPEAFERRESKHNTQLRNSMSRKGDMAVHYDFEILEQDIVGAENLSFREETNIRKMGGIEKDGGVLENKIHAMNETRYFELGGNLDKLGNQIKCN